METFFSESLLRKLVTIACNFQGSFSAQQSVIALLALNLELLKSDPDCRNVRFYYRPLL